MDIEFVACNNCGSENTTPVICGSDLTFVLEEKTEFTFQKCNECGLVYQNPRPVPTSIGKYYPESYSPHNKKSYSLLGVLKLNAFSYERDLVLKYCQEGNLLDVGCANGYFLNEMKKLNNWKLNGIEFSSTASQKARDTYGLDVLTGDLLDVNFCDANFDVVTMWNVLEHVYDPSATINEAWRILKSGGHLIIRVPNPESFAAIFFGKYWAGLDLPRHLFLFHKNVLVKMAEDAGFSLLRTTYWGFMWPTSVKIWYNSRKEKSNSLYDSFASRTIYRLSKSFPLRLLSFPFWEIINRINLGENMTLVFKKK